MDRDEERKRVTEIASSILTWAIRFTDLMNRIGEIEKIPWVTEVDREKMRTAARALIELFGKVAEMSEAQPAGSELVQQLIASHDRLSEKMTEANQLLDRILKDSSR